MDQLFGGLLASQLPASAEPSNQLESLLAACDTADAVQLQRLLQTLANSNLLQRLSGDQSQHKLTVRINSLIATQKVVGYRLASLWLAQSPSIWNAHLVNHAASWLNHVINLVSSPAIHNKPNAELLEAALLLVGTHILREASPSRQEFHRQVVTPNLTKFATVLVDAINNVLDKLNVFAYGRALFILVSAIDHHLRAHSTSCRALSSRIHAIGRKLLYMSERLRAASPSSVPPQLPLPLFTAAVRLLSSLHLTGALAAKSGEGNGGRATQAQLWQSTVASELASAKEAWIACVSSYDTGACDPMTTAAAAGGEGQQDTASATVLLALPRDPLVATQVALGRMELLLGARGRPGVIPLLLRTPTPRPVPVPFGPLLDFALSILRVGTHTPQRATTESALCALQAAHLPQHYLAALGLISQLALLSPQAVSLQASEVISEVCRLAEAAKGDNSAKGYAPRLRMAAFRTLVSLVGASDRGARLAMDPSGRTTLRAARLCSAQIAGVVLSPPGASDANAGANEAGGSFSNGNTQGGSGSSRKAKARLYESDAVFGSTSNPRDAIQHLQPEEVAATQAALEVLEVVFPHLATDLSVQHHDLAHISAQVVLALVEVLSGSQNGNAAPTHASPSSAGGPPTVQDLFCTSLSTLAHLLRASPSSMLALSLPRMTSLLVELSAVVDNASVRAAAVEALSTLTLARKGKMVPIARGLGFYPDANQTNNEFDATPEGSQLAPGVDRTLHLQPEVRETESIRSVLNLDSAPASAAAAGGDEARMNVEAITAESDSLTSAASASASSHPAAAEASPFASTGLGKGLPSPLSRHSSIPPTHSPPRPSSLRETRVFSPDPVKSAHRPSTPRVGSPSAFDRSANFGGSQKEAAATAAAEAGASQGKDLQPTTDDVDTAVSDAPATAATASPTAQDEETVVVTSTTTVTEAVDPANNAVTEAVQIQVQAPLVSHGNERDDDEEMPEIDLGDSGSEDGGAEEEDKAIDEDGERILV